MKSFIYEPRYDVVTYPTGEGWVPGWGTFQARILVNPSGAQRHTEEQLYDASNGTDRDTHDAYFTYIAPRIPEWNLVIRDESGAEAIIPPPAENWRSFYALEFPVMIWLRVCIHTAHSPESLGKLQGQTAPKNPRSTVLGLRIRFHRHRSAAGTRRSVPF